MKSIIYYIFILILVVSCDKADLPKHESKKTVDGISKIKNDAILDSIEKENNESVLSSGDDITKAYISLKDSSFSIRANMRKDHRIIGYSKPDINSKRLIIFSIFTDDVENNPFGCEFGAYYDTEEMENISLKFKDMVNDFVEVIAFEQPNKMTEIYFTKTWIIFE